MIFRIPDDIRKRAKMSTDRISITPSELIDLLDTADNALNSNSNDTEHDALYLIRECLSEWFEDSTRRGNQ
jgi:hypothetical protein